MWEQKEQAESKQENTTEMQEEKEGEDTAHRQTDRQTSSHDIENEAEWRLGQVLLQQLGLGKHGLQQHLENRERKKEEDDDEEEANNIETQKESKHTLVCSTAALSLQATEKGTNETKRIQQNKSQQIQKQEDKGHKKTTTKKEGKTDSGESPSIAGEAEGATSGEGACGVCCCCCACCCAELNAAAANAACCHCDCIVRINETERANERAKSAAKENEQHETRPVSQLRPSVAARVPFARAPAALSTSAVAEPLLVHQHPPSASSLLQLLLLPGQKHPRQLFVFSQPRLQRLFLIESKNERETSWKVEKFVRLGSHKNEKRKSV